MSNNCSIHKNYIISLLSEVFYPEICNVFFEQGSIRSKIPSICQSSVNFRIRIDKSFSFCSRNDCFQIVFCHFIDKQLKYQDYSWSKSALFCFFCVALLRSLLSSSTPSAKKDWILWKLGLRLFLISEAEKAWFSSIGATPQSTILTIFLCKLSSNPIFLFVQNKTDCYLLSLIVKLFPKSRQKKSKLFFMEKHWF